MPQAFGIECLPDPFPVTEGPLPKSPEFAENGHWKFAARMSKVNSMLNTFDDPYKETCRVLAGLATPAAPYSALIEWIAQQSGGKNVLNVVYWMWGGFRPCLSIVMGRDSDVESFAGGQPVSRAVSEGIIARFHEILAEQRITKIVTENMFVIVSAFAPLTRIEANHQVPPEAVVAFQHQLTMPSVWLIQPHFENLRVFFHSNDQLAQSESSGIRQRIAKEYEAVIAPYDEYGYVREMPIQPVFDSRERFEQVYKGSWWGYDRDNS